VAQAVYVVTQATYLSANAVLFREDAFELAGEMVEVDGAGHGMTLSDRRLQRLRRPAGPASRPSAALPGGSACTAAVFCILPE
jgi:hypothetical protein